MKYMNPVVPATFIKRPNRFVAHVRLDGDLEGKEEVVHVKNTGRCRELLLPGTRVYLEDCRSHPGRKTRYSLIAVEKASVAAKKANIFEVGENVSAKNESVSEEKETMLVNMDSQAPNAVVAEGILAGRLPLMAAVTNLRREVTFGNSRFDMRVEGINEQGEVTTAYVEVKGVTLEHGGISAFPDAPTTRGRRHLLELAEAVAQGNQGVVVFLMQMRGPRLFVPHWERDPAFSEVLVQVQQAGVRVLAFDSLVTPDTMELGEPLPIQLNQRTFVQA
ncbi:DNA/RNA nuclease SfsA [Anoxynatronum buryatiense]|uniref:Sugar fermentation stimulation protein homolog n=1 Tax=Anoxynatronum buryatiense TaxID=489973 RepID=A0AA46AJ26_9CLOT|nr:DNA/RNA nuclease SfsA [Anoxynatronum buryatiense]SMP57335.1 sugar fermentation stimulation protein A [Anoxynatronum buryatiense]